MAAETATDSNTSYRAPGYRMALAAIAGFLFLGGCSKEYAPVYGAIARDGETTVAVVGHVTEASISKESLVHATQQVYFSKEVELASIPLVDIEFHMVQLTDTVAAYLPKSFKAYRSGSLSNLQPPPSSPSEHPAWETIREGLRYGLYGFLGGQALNVLSDITAGSSGRFYGDYFMNSPHNNPSYSFGDITWPTE